MAESKSKKKKIRAVNTDGEQMEFPESAWRNMPISPEDGTRYGWTLAQAAPKTEKPVADTKGVK